MIDPGPLEEQSNAAEQVFDTPSGEQDTSDAADAGAAETDVASETEAPPGAEVVAATAATFLEGLLKAMGFDCAVATEVDGDTAVVNVTGEGMGAVIGRRGQTLEALQELARTAVQRRLRARVRLNVDVESYRARRRESLAEYARSMAGRARERGTEIELEPMSAYERKIIHDAVGEIEGVTTFSEGEEPARKVIVRGTG